MEDGILGRPNRAYTAQPKRRFTMDWTSKAKRLLGNRTRHIHGNGQFAFVTPCRDREFSLWGTRAEAEQAMTRIQSCGADCHGVTAHYVADLGEAA
jgi:hypothetical protein